MVISRDSSTPSTTSQTWIPLRAFSLRATARYALSIIDIAFAHNEIHAEREHYVSRSCQQTLSSVCQHRLSGRYVGLCLRDNLRKPTNTIPVSILFASGDGGVSGSQSGSCSKFVPTFPSGCPYLTSVGATQGVSPETGASLSAGGFSNYFGVPSCLSRFFSMARFSTDWYLDQSSVVKSYIKGLGSTYSGTASSLLVRILN
jgi:hypothetical protein